jgi:hypothetical protein
MGFPSIEERLERLEKQNRWLKVLLLAVIVLAGGGVMLSVVSGVRAQAPQWRRTVEAEKFVLRDSNGKTRATLRVVLPDGPRLDLYDANGKPRVVLATPPSAGLLLTDASGMPLTVRVGSTGEGPGLFLFDANGNPRATLLDSDGPSLILQDAGGFRSVIGHAALTAPATGEQSQSSAASIHLFNKAGKVIWAAP